MLPARHSEAEIFIGTGAHGVNKLFILPALGRGTEHSTDSSHRHRLPPRGVVAFFVGDQVEDARQPPRVRELQDPRVQAAHAAAAFPGAAVAVVMPSRLEGGCACFDHFLHRTTATGEPLGYRAGSTAGFKAAEQLATLLQSASLRHAAGASAAAIACSDGKLKLSLAPAAAQAASTETSDASAGLVCRSPAEPRPPVYLVGFSKGGVVLNQLLTELSELYQPSALAPRKPLRAAPPRFDAVPVADVAARATVDALASVPEPAPVAAWSEAAALLRDVASVHYIDAGLNSRGAYLTDPQVAHGLGVAAAAQPGLHVTLHGTPRQWDDPLRPWLAVEKNRCLAALRAAGVPTEERKHFEGKPPSLLMHFECIVAAMVAPKEVNPEMTADSARGP